MEIPIFLLGKCLQQYQNLNYFDSDSLNDAIEKMLSDNDTTIGIVLQNDEENSFIDEDT